MGGFLWEGSTGARAVRLLRELPVGTVIETPKFAAMLDVKPGALHQLLANAVGLRLIKKIRGMGPCIGWKLGPGNDSATIERRVPPKPAPTAEELERRARAAERRRQREAERAAAAQHLSFKTPDWPPGFVSTFGDDRPRFTMPSIGVPDLVDEAPVPTTVPTWLQGLYGVVPPEIELRPTAALPKPMQLPLFDPGEIGEGGRARWRRLDVVLPTFLSSSNEPGWMQTTFLDA